MTRGDLANQATLGRLEATLESLCERYAFRVDAPALKRDAEAFLRNERARGTITTYALAVHLIEGQLTLEVGLSLPRRVGQVMVRVGGL